MIISYVTLCIFGILFTYSEFSPYCCCQCFVVYNILRITIRTVDYRRRR